MQKASILFIFLCLIAIAPLSNAETFYPGNDQYILGYVQSLFIHSYKLPIKAVSVKNGYIYIKENEVLGEIPSDQIIKKLEKALSPLEGVRGVILQKNNVTNLPVCEKEAPLDGIMPNHSLFHALIADPKWPRFTLAYQYNCRDKISKQNFAPNFGGSIPIYRGLIKNDIEWEFGIQGGLFALLDIGRNPSALVNADYYIT